MPKSYNVWREVKETCVLELRSSEMLCILNCKIPTVLCCLKAALPLKLGAMGCPETSMTTNRRCVTSQKSDSLIYNAARAWVRACDVRLLVTELFLTDVQLCRFVMLRKVSLNMTWFMYTISTSKKCNFVIIKPFFRVKNLYFCVIYTWRQHNVAIRKRHL
jgi:hypothetical protein